MFYTHAEPKNMKLVVLKGTIHVKVKPITMQLAHSGQGGYFLIKYLIYILFRLH